MYVCMYMYIYTYIEWRNKKSAVAANVWKEKYTMECKPVLLKHASKKQELTTKKKRKSHKF